MKNIQVIGAQKVGAESARGLIAHTVEDADKVLAKSFTARLTEASTFGPIVETWSGFKGWMKRCLEGLRINWIAVCAGVLILIELLMLAHFMIGDKRREEESPFGGLS